MLSPIIDEISEEVKDISFVKVDIEQVPEVSEAFNIQSIPTIILFKNGEPIGSFMGYRPKSEILKFINEKK
ncbi:hypothetical protein FACS1894166_00330 [Bacilli bacterium]|nr:hypothetical protein FACS1894166_00330 [Bacilli bacterium]